jgi:hypothetical protein
VSDGLALESVGTRDASVSLFHVTTSEVGPVPRSDLTYTTNTPGTILLDGTNYNNNFAFSFSKSSGGQGMELDDGTANLIDTDFTLECFIDFSSIPDSDVERMFFVHKNGGAGIYYLRVISAAANRKVTVFFNPGTGPLLAHTHDVSALVGWHHFAVTHDRNGPKKMYIDGVEVNSQSPGTASLQDIGTGAMCFGAFDQSLSANDLNLLSPFEGDIDEFRMCNEILVPSQFLQIAP